VVWEHIKTGYINRKWGGQKESTYWNLTSVLLDNRNRSFYDFFVFQICFAIEQHFYKEIFNSPHYTSQGAVEDGYHRT